MQVTLINHACVKIAIGDAVILCDPWLSGPAFNNGWDLLIKTPLTLDEVMAGVTHIWVSHEHPDHFVPKFFIDISAAYKSIPVLFQETRDRRVKSFIESRGFDVTELPDRREQHDRRRARDLRRQRILRFMAAPARRHAFGAQSQRLRRGRRGRAARDRRAHRPDRHAAHPVQLRGLEGRTRQRAFPRSSRRGASSRPSRRRCMRSSRAMSCRSRASCTSPTRRIPTSTITSTARPMPRPRSPRPAPTPAILFPGETWDASTPHDNATALASFDKVYGALDALPLAAAGRERAAGTARTGIRQISRARLPAELASADQAAAPPARARRVPSGRRSASPISAPRSASRSSTASRPRPAPEDVAMHSSSLSFLFNNPFGFDTLTVNGRFEATPEGFGKMTKSLAIGSLNAMGLAVSPRLVMNLKVVLMLLRRLAGGHPQHDPGQSRRTADLTPEAACASASRMRPATTTTRRSTA